MRRNGIEMNGKPKNLAEPLDRVIGMSQFARPGHRHVAVDPGFLWAFTLLTKAQNPQISLSDWMS